MFNSIEVFRMNELANSEIEIADPDTIVIVENDFSKKYYTLNVESRNNLYRELDMKYKLSKDLFAKNISNWKSLIEEQETFEYKSRIKDSIFIVDIKSNSVLSIIMPDTIDNYLDKKYILDKIEYVNGICQESTEYYSNCLYKVVYDIDEYKFIFEINTIASTYRMYTMKESNGILTPVFGSNAIIDANNLRSFLDSDFEYEINLVKALKNSDFEYNKDAKLSLREVFNVIKWSKLKVNLDENNMVDSFENVPNEKSKFLIKYLNSFDMPYKSLSRITDIRKSMKYSDIDFVTFNEFLDYIYLSDITSNLTLRIINYTFESTDFDKSDIGCIKEELKLDM